MVAKSKYTLQIEAAVTGQKEINSLADSVESLGDSATEAGPATGELADELRALGAEKAAVDNFQALESALERVSQKQASNRAEMERTQSSLQGVGEGVSRLRKGYADLEKESKDLNKAEQAQRTALGALRAEIKKATEDKRALKKEAAALKKEIAQSDGPADDLKETYQALRKEIEKLEDTQRNNRKEVARLAPELNKTIKANKEQASFTKRVSKELERAEKQSRELAKAYGRQEKEARSLTAVERKHAEALKGARAEMRRLGLDTNNTVRTQVQLQGKLSAARDAVDNYRATLEKSGATGISAGKKIRRGLDDGAKGADVFAASLATARNYLLGLVGVAGLQRLGRNVLEGADAWKRYEAQLKLATDSAEEQSEAERALFEISQESRTELEGNVELYARLARSREELGLSQDDLISTTEVLAKALKVSGASAQEAASVTTQLGQALASGSLQGDELRSVLENGGRAAKALADGLGVPIGALKELGAEGELTSRKVIDALISQRDAINRAFETLPQSPEGALTRITNEFTRYVGESEVVGTASEKIVALLNTMADNFDEVADLAFKAGEIIVAAFAVKGIAALKGYVTQVKAAAAATGALTTATAAQGRAAGAAAAATRGLAGALKGAGYVAIAVEIMDVVGAMAQLYQQEKKNLALEEEIQDKRTEVADNLLKISESTGIAIETMDDLNRLAKEGSVVFDEVSGRWLSSAQALDELGSSAAKAGDSIKQAADNFQTDADVQSSFFVQLQAELANLTQDGIPAFQKKLADLSAAELLSEGQASSLSFQLVELAKSFQVLPDAIDKTNAELQENANALANVETGNKTLIQSAADLERQYNEGAISLEEFSQASSALVDQHKASARAAKENATETGKAGEAIENTGQAANAAGGVMQAMIDHVQGLRDQMQALSPAAEKAFLSLISESERARNPAQDLQNEIKDIAHAIRDIDVEIQSRTQLGRWFLRTEQAALKVKKAFLEQQSAADSLIKKLEGMDGANRQIIESAERAATRYQLLDESTLSKITGQVERLRNEHEALESDIQRSIDSYQDELDRLLGNEAQIEQRRLTRERLELEEKYQEAIRRGDIALQQQIREALEVQRRVHEIKLKQLGEELNFEQAITRERQRQVLPGTLTGGSGGGGSSVPVGSGGALGAIPVGLGGTGAGGVGVGGGPLQTLPATPQPVQIDPDSIRDALRPYQTPAVVLELDGKTLARTVTPHIERDGTLSASDQLFDAAMVLGHRP